MKYESNLSKDIEDFTDTELIDDFRIVATEMLNRKLFNPALNDMFNLTSVQFSHSDEVVKK